MSEDTRLIVWALIGVALVGVSLWAYPAVPPPAAASRYGRVSVVRVGNACVYTVKSETGDMGIAVLPVSAVGGTCE